MKVGQVKAIRQGRRQGYSAKVGQGYIQGRWGIKAGRRAVGAAYTARRGRWEGEGG